MKRKVSRAGPKCHRAERLFPVNSLLSFAVQGARITAIRFQTRVRLELEHDEVWTFPVFFRVIGSGEGFAAD
jgi:hypothetical protein